MSSSLRLCASLRTVHFATLNALVLLGFGCGDVGSAGETAAADWKAEVELRIGSVDDAESALTSVGSILPGEGGRFYVTQPQDGQVRIHAPEGELVGRFGRSGEGPGEFQGMSALGWWGGGRDTLWVSDNRLRRVSLFRPDGTFVRSIQITAPPYQEVMRPGVQTILPDGTALGTPSFNAQLLADGSIKSIPLLRFALAGGAPEVVAETPPGNRQLALQFGTGVVYSSQPYGDSPLLAASGEAERIVVVEAPAAAQPSGARIRVTTLSAAGDTLWSREYPYEPMAVPAAEVDSVVDDRSALLTDFASRAGASRAEVERQLREKMYLPAFRPPMAAARISSDGSVWLQWTTAPGEAVNRWLGLDPEGSPVARLELPRNLRLLDVQGSSAWAVETDDLGVPYVVRLRLGPKDPAE